MLIGQILELYVCKHLLSFRRSLDSSSSQQGNLADAVPPPEPSSDQPPELSPEPPQESRPSQHAVSVYEDSGKIVISPKKAGSPGSNPSHDSASRRHPTLVGTNTVPHKDKGKGKGTETVDAGQLKGASGEISSPHTNILHQPAPTMATSWETRKRARRRGGQSTKHPHGGESSLPQNPEPNQNNDSQERFQGMMAHSVRVFSANNLRFGF